MRRPHAARPVVTIRNLKTIRRLKFLSNRLISTVFLAAAVTIAGCADTSEFLTERTHPEGWLNSSSPDFHGLLVLESVRKAVSCQSCHGEDYSGGTANVSCASCHAAYPHPEGFAVPSNPMFHEAFFQETLNWDLTSCQSCHGEEYDGRGGVDPDGPGMAAKNCLSCHREDDGPEDCSTCHGGSENFAPPQDLSDGEATDERGVGAHQAHIASAIADLGLECSHCHVNPDDYSDAGHVLQDDTPGMAEVVFGPLSTRNGELDVTYDVNSLTCGNSYCHGNFEFSKAESSNQFAYAEDFIRGNNAAVIWNEVGTGQADCGTCHGLPPTGHISGSACNNCHGSVVDANLNIIDKTLHINGEVDVF